MTLNCSAVPASLLESELFGHEKGAYTSATSARAGVLREANKGTLFLDEIGDMPLPMQAALLRAVEGKSFRSVGGPEREGVSLRVISASHKDLWQGVAQGWFRADLLYRLDQVSIALPPLRERRGDVRELAQFFLGEERPRLQKQNRWPKSFSEEALRTLEEQPWWGNVRELQTVLKRVLYFTSSNDVSREDVLRWIERARLLDNRVDADLVARIRGTAAPRTPKA